MFTGLIQNLGTVEQLSQTAAGARINIATELVSELSKGDSIAANGICLTATELGKESFTADVMNETLRRTSLSELEVGSPVNLELPLKPTDRLGGHVVQGHVDGVGRVAALSDDGLARSFAVTLEPALLRYLVPKGSVAIDGVSLTIAALSEDGFVVSLIPETLERTNLGAKVVGNAVNIEVDVLAKHVERLTKYP